MMLSMFTMCYILINDKSSKLLGCLLLLVSISCGDKREFDNVNAIDIWYLPFSVDTRVPVTSANMLEFSSTKYIKIEKAPDLDSIVAYLGRLQKKEMEWNESENLRVLMKIHFESKDVDTLRINLNRDCIYYGGRSFVYGVEFVEYLSRLLRF